jgi:four helix bundle protein
MRTGVIGNLTSNKEAHTMYKFERLKVYQLSLDYIDQVYGVTAKLPRNEEYNLGSQIKRAATSSALNIAEGSTGQSDPEQARFLSMAIRSLLETVACKHIIERRGYLRDHATMLRELDELGKTLARSLQAMRKSVLN